MLREAIERLGRANLPPEDAEYIRKALELAMEVLEESEFNECTDEGTTCHSCGEYAEYWPAKHLRRGHHEDCDWWRLMQ